MWEKIRGLEGKVKEPGGKRIGAWWKKERAWWERKGVWWEMERDPVRTGQ